MKIIKKQGSEFPGYKKVDYIQFNGTQKIDTGVYPDSTTIVQCKYIMTHYNGGCFIGGDTDNDNDNFRFFRSGSTTYLDYGNGYGNRISGTYVTSTTDIYETEFGNKYVKDLTTGTIKFSGSTVTFSERSYTIKICKNSDYGKIYYCKIYKGGILVRDYIPVISDSTNTVGLLDKVNMIFYTDVNNNSFTYGQIIDEEDKYYCIKKLDVVIKYYGINSSSNILYQPKLDGTEQITTMSGRNSPTITNNTLSGYTSSGTGGCGYLSEGWDNTGLWQLTCKARINGTTSTSSAIQLVCNTTSRDNNLLNITPEHVWRYNGTSSTKFTYSPTLAGSTMHDVVITKIDSTTVTVQVDSGTAVTISGFTPLAQTNKCYIGVDSWSTGSSNYAIISNILVIKK